MSGKDEYYNRAKQEGYRTRSAYKLRQLDDAADLLSTGDTVVDLGAAPGGWLQVAAERVGPSGRVVGVDRQRIDPLEHEAVGTVRGDVTDEETLLKLRAALDPGFDGRPGDYDPGGDPAVDVVLSDMAPNVSGEYELDHARSVHLARTAFEVATELLAPGGDLVVKVFDGRDTDALRAEIGEAFQYVRTVHPEASRDASSELYLVGKGRTAAPVAEGDRLEVRIVDVGEEGDGIARVEGYTVFVEGATEGETVAVEITDVKPRFGFARRRE